MKIFELDSYRNYSKGPSYASTDGYGRFNGIERYLDLYPYEKKRMTEFWEVNPDSTPGYHIHTGFSHWPDIMWSTFAPPGSLFSQKAIETLDKFQTEFEFKMLMPPGEILSKRLLKKERPDYFILKFLPGIEVDWEASGYEVDESGGIKTDPLPTPWPPEGIKVKAETWNGRNVFTYSNWNKRGVSLLCTEEVVEATKKDGWEGYEIRELEAI